MSNIPSFPWKPLTPAIAEPEPAWSWLNCRSIGFGLEIWPLEWALALDRSDSVYGGTSIVHVGPLVLELHYSIGNCSSENRFTAAFGLSEAEAWERAARRQGLL
ncbi:MAG: hypothetical protein AAGI03_06835 [Pseudomonadota bacterium]